MQLRKSEYKLDITESISYNKYRHCAYVEENPYRQEMHAEAFRYDV